MPTINSIAAFFILRKSKFHRRPLCTLGIQPLDRRVFG